jgi:hypothetical protein
MLCNSRLSKAKKHAQGTCVKACTRKIQLAEIQLQRVSLNKEVMSILFDSQGKLTEVFQNSVERNHHFSSSNWLKYRDSLFLLPPYRKKENLFVRAGNRDGDHHGPE